MRGPRHEYCPNCMTTRSQPVPLVASSLFKHALGDSSGAGSDTLAAKAGNVVAAMRTRHAF
jgi:hypothetical protein